MKLRLLNCLVVLGFCFSGLAEANVTQEDFLARKTQNLINLCTASPEDTHYREAIHFCHGYLVGAVHFNLAESANKPESKLVCFPQPYPSRNQSIDMFVAWAQKHPEFMNELPVETEFRFLSQQWPCKK